MLSANNGTDACGRVLWKIENAEEPEDEGFDYELLEINSPQLLKAFQEDQALCFKGQPEDPLMLCTMTQTFSVQELCISNSILVTSTDPFTPDLSIRAKKRRE